MKKRKPNPFAHWWAVAYEYNKQVIYSAFQSEFAAREYARSLSWCEVFQLNEKAEAPR